jgi:serine/threonine protein kinase
VVSSVLSHYNILRKIGSGGMGEVYLAEDTRLGRQVALKLLPAHLTADKTRLQRFRQEARAASALNHPNILTIYEIGEADGHHFIATEFIEGETLRRRLDNSRLEIGSVLDVAIQISSALAAAHAKGIVHRDIKPENVMLRRDGYVKVLDFGLAKLTEQPINSEASTFINTEAGVVLGTVNYMSPEQVRGTTVDARTDIWSFGVVLYEMVAGRRPHEGPTTSDVIASILEREPPRLAELAPGVPSELERIVHKCLEKDLENRYLSVSEMQVDLRPLSSSTSAPTIVAPARQRRRWPLLILVVIPLLVVLLGLVAWLGGPLFQPPLPSLITTPLTSFVGMEWSASLSPDDNFFAYAHNRHGQMDIFVLPTSGGDPVRLTNTPADELAARWAPDGRHIAFISDRGTGSNIYVIPPLGGSERKIAETNIPWLSRGTEALASTGGQPWSPDASQLIFSRLEPAGAIALWKVNLRTNQLTQVTKPDPGTTDIYATWAFDGKRIVFMRKQGKGDSSLWLVSPEGGEPELLFPDDDSERLPARRNVRTPSWSIDSQRVLFVSGGGGTPDLWEIEVASRRLRQVTSSSAGLLNPAVSRSGKIVFARYTHQVDIYWGRIDQPQDQHQRLTSHTHNNFGARVSPDGQRVLYFSDRTGSHTLWLLDRGTGTERRLTDSTGPDLMGDWSPDGNHIVFLSGREGRIQVWVMDVETGRASRISERGHMLSFEPHFSGPRWSPDGKAIGFIASSDTEEPMVITDVDGSNERSPLPGVNTFDWWRDSKHVIYTAKAPDGVMEMRCANLETGNEVVLLRGPTAEIVVARDGSAVAYVHSLSHFAMQVIVQRLAPGPDGLPRPVGPPKQLTTGANEWHVHMGGWSPDGKVVVYTRDADSGDIYMIQDFK